MLNKKFFFKTIAVRRHNTSLAQEPQEAAVNRVADGFLDPWPNVKNWRVLCFPGLPLSLSSSVYFHLSQLEKISRYLLKN